MPLMSDKEYEKVKAMRKSRIAEEMKKKRRGLRDVGGLIKRPSVSAPAMKMYREESTSKELATMAERAANVKRQRELVNRTPPPLWGAFGQMVSPIRQPETLEMPNAEMPQQIPLRGIQSARQSEFAPQPEPSMARLFGEKVLNKLQAGYSTIRAIRTLASPEKRREISEFWKQRGLKRGYAEPSIAILQKEVPAVKEAWYGTDPQAGIPPTGLKTAAPVTPVTAPVTPVTAELPSGVPAGLQAARPAEAIAPTPQAQAQAEADARARGVVSPAPTLASAIRTGARGTNVYDVAEGRWKTQPFLTTTGTGTPMTAEDWEQKRMAVGGGLRGMQSVSDRRTFEKEQQMIGEKQALESQRAHELTMEQERTKGTIGAGLARARGKTAAEVKTELEGKDRADFIARSIKEINKLGSPPTVGGYEGATTFGGVERGDSYKKAYNRIEEKYEYISPFKYAKQMKLPDEERTHDALIREVREAFEQGVTGTSLASAGTEKPPLPNAEQGADGKWYIPDPNRPGKYQIVGNT